MGNDIPPEAPPRQRRLLVNIGLAIVVPAVGITLAVILGLMSDSTRMGSLASLAVVDPSTEPEGSDSGGGDPDPQAGNDEPKEPTETASPKPRPTEAAEPEADPVVVDGCDLLKDEEVSTTFGGTYRKRVITAGPDYLSGSVSEGPWWSGCYWDQEQFPVGFYSAGVSVHTDVDIDEVREFYELGTSSQSSDPFMPERVPDLGDEAWLIPYDDGNGSVVVELDLMVFTGTTVLVIERHVPFEDGGITRSVDSQLLLLGRKALERLPENPEVDPGEPGPECSRIDRTQADVATGATLLGTRELTTEKGQLFCSFRGTSDTFLEVMVRDLDEDSQAEFEAFGTSDGVIRKNGLGDEAYVQIVPGDHSRYVMIRVGEQMIDVSMNCPCVVGASADAPLTDDQVTLIDSIVYEYAQLDG